MDGLCIKFISGHRYCIQIDPRIDILHWFDHRIKVYYSNYIKFDLVLGQLFCIKIDIQTLNRITAFKYI